LEEAIRCHCEAVTLFPQGHPDRAASLSNLGTAVFIYYEQSGKIGDLEDGMTCHREALAFFPQDHPKRAVSLNNLGKAVFTRFQLSGRMEDLHATVKHLFSALAVIPIAQLLSITSVLSCPLALINRPHGHPNRSSSLNNLANSVSTALSRREGWRI